VTATRQAWIDALRQDTATLIANGGVILDAKFNQRLPDPLNSLAANDASVRIKLRLNPTEPASMAVLKMLDEHESYFEPPTKAGPAKRITETETELIAAMQKVLKQEWNRVRSGETIYRVTRAVAIGVTLFSVAALFGIVLLIGRFVFHGHP